MDESQRIHIGVLAGFRKDRFGSNLTAAENASGPLPAVGLFELPRHVMEKWQTALSASGEGEHGFEISPELFAGFARAVIEFLQFKRVQLPAECRCNLLAVPPAAGRLEATEPQNAAGHHAALVIHLGPDAASVWFHAAPETGGGSDQEDGKVNRAPIEIQLQPGQGYMLHNVASFRSEYACSGALPGMCLVIESN